MERYELLFKIDKEQSHLRILGESFFKRNQASGYFIYIYNKYGKIQAII